MARPAMPFDEMTRQQQLRRCQYLRQKGEYKQAELLKKNISAPTKTPVKKSTKTTKTPVKKSTKSTKTPVKKSAKTTKKTNVTKLSLVDESINSSMPKIETKKIQQTPKTQERDHKSDSLNLKNQKFLDELEAQVGSRQVKIIDINSKKKFLVDPEEGIIEAPTLRRMIKDTIYRKSFEATSIVLSVDYLVVMKSFIKVFPLIAMAILYSGFLIMQGQDSYKLMGLPYHNILAVGMVVTLGILKLWSAASKSWFPLAIMIGIALFEGFVLYSGTEINSSADKSEMASRKAFLTSEITRLEDHISNSKNDIKSYESVTTREIAKITDEIEAKKRANVWNYRRDPEIVGVLDLQGKLNNYETTRLSGLKDLRSEFEISSSQEMLSKHRAEVASLVPTANELSDKATKALIFIILILNMYVFHCLGRKLKKTE